MKKLINKSLFFLALSLFIFHSCDDVEIVQLNSDANTSLSLSVSEVVLSEENLDENALTISWETPDFGFDAAPSYTILMDVAGGDFAARATAGRGAHAQRPQRGAAADQDARAGELQRREEAR